MTSDSKNDAPKSALKTASKAARAFFGFSLPGGAFLFTVFEYNKIETQKIRELFP